METALVHPRGVKGVIKVTGSLPRLRCAPDGIIDRYQVPGVDPPWCNIVVSLRSVTFKIDRIHPFDIRYLLFDVRCSMFISFFLD